MEIKRTVDFVAFAFASLLTVVVAAFVAWWYSLGVTSLMPHALLYLGLFAMAVGIPAYYFARALRQSPSGNKQLRDRDVSLR